MRPTDHHSQIRAWGYVIVALCISLSLSAQSFVTDRGLLDAYLQNDMSVWKAHIDTASVTPHLLAYEYGYCAALMDIDKNQASPYVDMFREHIEFIKETLPPGHYQMYMSAVYVYKLRLHESIHPVKALSLAKEAVEYAPNDPMTLSYCGTALFYAPKPFGNKNDALDLFLRAEQLFKDEQWYNCWWRPATLMYIAQCYEKKGKTSEAINRAKALLAEYPDYLYIRDTYLPNLILQ